MNHFNVSIVKSLMRIIGCITVIASQNLMTLCAVCFLIAELLGIFEEIVDKRKEK